MGGEVGEPSTKTYTDTFKEVFPYYLSIGMSYDLFWNGEPWLVKAYREAEEMRVDRMNYESWLQGLYIYHGVGALSPILNSMSKKKKADEYMSEPLTITQRAKNEKERKKGQQTANFLIAWAESLKKKGVKNGGS